jgi:DNA-binding transcriptional MerR regulator/methylmalonyl-CoA mutase cobalamin-binding subunit
MGQGAAPEPPRYSLGAVARMLGVTPHLLRAWERRYGAVRPARTAGGTRRYTESDVRRLRLLRAGIGRGHPIGEIAPLPLAELERRFGPLAPERAAPSEALWNAIARVDGAEIERLLGLQLGALGPSAFVHEVALPLLRAVGERWRSGEVCVAAEHAVSAAVRSLLGAALRLRRETDGPRIVFATPPGERHELGLLAAAVCALERGARVTYLGPDLPAEELALAAREQGAAAAVLALACTDGDEVRRELQEARLRLGGDVALWIGGAGSAALPPIEGVRIFADLRALEAAVDALLAAGGPRRRALRDLPSSSN